MSADAIALLEEKYGGGQQRESAQVAPEEAKIPT